MVAAAVEIEVHFVGTEAVLALSLQHTVEDNIAKRRLNDVVKQGDLTHSPAHGVGDDRPLDVPEEHGVFHLALKKLDSLPTLAIVRVRVVLEQVGQHLQEMRLTGADGKGSVATLAVFA